MTGVDNLIHRDLMARRPVLQRVGRAVVGESRLHMPDGSQDRISGKSWCWSARDMLSARMSGWLREMRA
jgi:hypothetical protein